MSVPRRYPRTVLALLLALALLAPTLALTPNARAADCQVTNGNNSGDGSLRAALARTNNFTGSDCATISFAPGVAEVALTSFLTVSRAVSIVGPGMDALTLRRTGGTGLTGLVFSIIDGGALDLRGVTVTGGNVTSGPLSGGLAVVGSDGQSRVSLALDGVRVANNHTTGSGGGIYASNATLTIANSRIEDNQAGQEGGGIYLTDLRGGVTAMLTNSIVRSNSAAGDGGGIRAVDATAQDGKAVTLTLEDSTVSGNAGIGIYASSTDLSDTVSVSLTDTTVSDNTGVGLAQGGRPATLINSTISGNQAGGVSALQADVTLTNSTVSGNIGRPGIAVGQGQVILTHTTVVGNTSQGIVVGNASGTMRASIVAGNRAGQAASDCSTAFPTDLSSLGDNLVGAGCPTNGSGDVTLTGALATVLDLTLADNGGPTKTHNLVSGSPAIDHIDSCTVSNDQRGVTRPKDDPTAVGTGCDIGAVEYTPPAPSPSPSPSPSSSPSTGPCGTRFGDVPSTDPACVAIEGLAARGVINGCDSSASPPLFCPNDPTLREQMAALIVRAIPDWANETGQPSFSDNTEDAELMQRVATLQRHAVVRGYQDEVCISQGKQPPCYGPLDTVKYGQVLLFIARAMVANNYWTLQPDDRTIFPDQNGAVGADPDTDQQTLDHRSVVTYVHYVGNPPDVADVHAPFQIGGVAHGGWGDDSTRAWFTRAFWPAIQNH